MKKIASLILGLLALDAQASKPTPYFNGIMIGGALGATAAQFDISNNFNFDFGNGSNFSLVDELNLFANTPMVLVSIGYAYQDASAFTFGGYFTAAYSDAKNTNQKNYQVGSDVDTLFIVDSSTIAQLTNDFAILLKAGYVWERTTHFYGLVGPRWGNFQTTVDLNIFRQNIGFVETYEDSQSSSAYALGFTMGLGIQQMLTPRYSWSLEYNYTAYGSIEMPENVGTVFSNKPSSKAMTNTLMFMINYRI